MTAPTPGGLDRDGLRDWRPILREAADTQHVAVLTWQESIDLLDTLDKADADRAAVERVEALANRWEALGWLHPSEWGSPTATLLTYLRAALAGDA